MEPIEIIELAPDEFRLTLVAGATDVDGVITELSPVATDPDRARAMIAAAETRGFRFDD